MQNLQWSQKECPLNPRKVRAMPRHAKPVARANTLARGPFWHHAWHDMGAMSHKDLRPNSTARAKSPIHTYSGTEGGLDAPPWVSFHPRVGILSWHVT